jgi:hypothetical protein
MGGGGEGKQPRDTGSVPNANAVGYPVQQWGEAAGTNRRRHSRHGARSGGRHSPHSSPSSRINRRDMRNDERSSDLIQ